MVQVNSINQNNLNTQSVGKVQVDTEKIPSEPGQHVHMYQKESLHAACCGSCLRANVERESGKGTGFDKSA